jgi:ABC-type transport system involved in multi-copper enzyme maturation permease subunit
MGLKKFIEFEFKKATGTPYIVVFLVFLIASGYLFYHGVTQYKHMLEEESNFVEFEQGKYKYYIYPSKHGNYGIRVFYKPSPFMAVFDSGPVPLFMTTFIDGSERMEIYQPLKGQSAFSIIKSMYTTFAGFILLFGSGLILLYGYSGPKNHAWLNFLEGLAGSRWKLFLYHLISRTFILLLYCLVIGLLSIILFIVAGESLNIGWVLTYTLGLFAMLWCFLFGGLIAGTLKNGLWRWAFMGISWFSLSFVIPVLICHFTYDKATSIKSTYKAETVKLELFQEYESEGLQKGGKFDQSKRGKEQEKGMFLFFWNGGFKKLMAQEKAILNEMKDRISFYQTASAFFPSTFYISSSLEMSSRGFSNLVEFNEYSQEMKAAYIWYLAQNYIFSNMMEFPPFIKKDENVYKGKISLPGNYGFGWVIKFIWLIVLLGLYWFMFNRMLDRAQDTQRELNPDELKNNRTNVIFTLDKGLLPQLIKKLRLKNISFLSVPGPDNLPGGTTVKNLLSLFGLAVPEALEEIAGKYIYTLEPDQKGKVLLEIAGALKADVLIFDNFLAGLSDAIIHSFASILNSLKKGRKVVYFTNSILINAIIGDKVKRFNDEDIPF